MSFAHRLYEGEVSFDFVGRRKIWYSFSALVLAIGIVAMIVQGFNWGIDFRGGDAFQFKAGSHSTSDAKHVLSKLGIEDPIVQKIGQDQIRVQTKPLHADTDPAKDQVSQVSNALAKEFGLKADQLNPQSVGASWGSQITRRAIQGLIVFLIAVTLYIAVRYDFKMSLAAMVALLHDLVVTAGIYALVGFEVTPNTVIALLTILGFSLYDTVVVFDTVRENTAKLGPRSTQTYSQAANHGVNQTLMRSINTSIIALLPVAALLFVGAGLLGAGTLKELALAQMIGLAAGAYSSIFIATPLLAQLREREPEMVELRKRVAFLEKHKPQAVVANRAAGTASASAPARTATAVLDRPATAPESAGGADDASVTQPPDRPPGPAVPAREPGSPMVRHDPRSRRGRGAKRSRPSGKRRR
ncbi:MAG TPA: protein translocase subunit SecF [Mycobacteriales bacterium]|nr:protein translocase subunit SecF [Mycobacteriales bacterium]